MSVGGGDEAGLTIRQETAADAGPIATITRAAFRDHPFSQQTEHLIVDALRSAGALGLSLVAVRHGEVVGHAAFSRVSVSGLDLGWWGLGPVSVWPPLQRTGVGSALIREGLRCLGEHQAAGCVVLGDPRYYERFGFAVRAGLVYPGPSADHFMALTLRGAAPVGAVAYHPAFSVAA